ncbi:hypothetical protein ACNQ1X_03195, partial [Mycoplasma sp. SK341A]|uniref:hypothetical protein n=1 Tax=Mycoplasma sp. SK341A TaxID=3401679 RepID=UPI003AAC361D
MTLSSWLNKYIYLTISILLCFTLFSIYGVLVNEQTRWDFDIAPKAKVIVTYIIVSGLIAALSGFLMSLYLLSIKSINNFIAKVPSLAKNKKTLQITTLSFAILIVLIMIISILVMAWVISITNVADVQITSQAKNAQQASGIQNLNSEIIAYFLISYVVSFSGTCITTMLIKAFIHNTCPKL